jgi:hypothetical protein
MKDLMIYDSPEWEDVKNNFVNSGDFSKTSKISAIQRLTKEYAVGMDDAEAIVDRWVKERRNEIYNAPEKVTIGDILKKKRTRRVER